MHRRSLIGLAGMASASLTTATAPMDRLWLRVKLPGWSAEAVAQQFAEPMEAWLLQLPNLQRFASTSSDGHYQVELTLRPPNADADWLRRQLDDAAPLVGKSWVLDTAAPARGR